MYRIKSLNHIEVSCIFIKVYDATTKPDSHNTLKPGFTNREGFYVHEVEEYKEMFCKFLSPVLITVRSVVCTSALILKL